jgi:hypothetical protein
LPAQCAPDVPWLDENPLRGVVPAGGAQAITVDFDARAVAEPGTYDARLLLLTADPVYPQIEIPVRMIVSPVRRSVTIGPAQEQAAGPGAVVSYWLNVTNTTPLALADGNADSYTVSVPIHNWPTRVTPEVVGPLAGGESATVKVEVQIPPATGAGLLDVAQIRAQSHGADQVQATVEVTTHVKTDTYQLTVARAGTGGGQVVSAPPGINCGTDCTEIYVEGTPVLLAAVPLPGSTFAGWSGAVTGTTNPITLSLDDHKTVTATFTTQLGLALKQTAGIDPAVCAAASDVTVLAGSRLYYCYTVQNTGSIPLIRHTLANSFQGTVFADLPYALAPGATANTVALGVAVSQTVAVNTTAMATWTAAAELAAQAGATVELAGATNGSPAADGTEASTSAQSRITVVPGGLTVAATVGTQPGSCTDVTAVEVPADSNIFFCVTLHNTGAALLTGFVFTARGQSVALPPAVSVPPGGLFQVTSSTSPLLGPVKVTEPLTITLGVTAQAGGGVLGQIQTQSTPVIVSLETTDLDTTDEPVDAGRVFLPWIMR